MVHVFKTRLLLIVVLILFVSESVMAQLDIIKDDWPMFADPPMIDEVLNPEISDQLIPAWIQALSADEQELRLVAAKTIGRAADLNVSALDLTVEPLIAVVSNAKNRPLVRHTAAMALVELDAASAGESLLAVVKDGDFNLSVIVEPALIRWKTPGALEMWRTRFEANESPTLVRLAIQGLGALGTVDDHQSLIAFAVDTTNNAVLRITAAQSLISTLKQPELDHAERLAASQSPVDHLVAAFLSSPKPQNADGSRSLAVITDLMSGSDATVYAVCLEGLGHWNPQAILDFGERISRHETARVRTTYVDALNQLIDVDRVSELATFTNDRHPGIRVKVRQWLLEASEVESLLPEVLNFIQSALVSDQWRSQEQAMHIAVELDQKQFAVDVVSLLQSERNEVIATSGWALRRLAVEETLAPALKYCESLSPAFEGERLPYDLMFSLNEQFAHLFQMFGQMKYRDSIKVLHRFIRKNQLIRFRVRAAATWAAGLIFEGDLAGDPKLEKALLDRLNDDAPMPPEDDLVKRMAAISLARIGSTGEFTISSLWKYYHRTKPFGPLRDGTEYALHRLIGEEFPTPDPKTYTSGPWLIEPYVPKK
ncbi:MAG: HEAT repeat domain-containing protein [Planctomycetota bacterium]|nr:HEAT repeat domain-containing protein [Planctomycetota bacterium]